MDKEFQCCQCSHELNLLDRLPHVLPSCGHSVCYFCVNLYVNEKTKLICLEDSIECDVPNEISYFPINQNVIALLKKRRTINRTQTYFLSSDDYVKEVSQFEAETETHHHLSQSHSYNALPKTNLCQIHHKDLQLVCQQEGEYICVDCALFGKHKYHNYKPIQLYAKEMEQAVNDIMPIYQEIKDLSNKIETLKFLEQFEQNFTQKRGSTLHQIDLKFEELFEDLRIIQAEIKHKIYKSFNSHFEEQKLILEKEFFDLKPEVDNWIKQADKQFQAFLNIQQNDQIFILDEKILEIGKKLGEKINDKCKLLDSTIQNIVNQQDLFIPIDQIKHCFDKQEPLLIDNTKLTDSDLIFYEPHTYQSLRVSEQPTQPASPQYEVQKNNYFSQAQTPLVNKKERSVTYLQTEPNVEVQIQLNSRYKQMHSNQKSQRTTKFSNNLKMNEKIIQCLTQFEKNEMVDFSLVGTYLIYQDFNEQIVLAIGEGLKNRKIVKVLKLNKCKIIDDMFTKLLQVLDESRQRSIQALHLQSNLLTDKCLDVLLSFSKNKRVDIKQIYLNGNPIIVAKNKKKVEELKKLGIQVLI